MTHVDLIEKLLRYGCSLTKDFLIIDLVWGIGTTHRNGTGPGRWRIPISPKQNYSRYGERGLFKFLLLEFPSTTKRTPLRVTNSSDMNLTGNLFFFLSFRGARPVYHIIQLQSDILSMSLFQNHICVSRTDCLFASVVRDISALVTTLVGLAEPPAMTRTAEYMLSFRSFSSFPLPLIPTHSTILTLLAYLTPRLHQSTSLSIRGI